MGDLLALYEARKREVAGLDDDEYEGIEAEELSDEEAAEELRLKRVGLGLGRDAEIVQSWDGGIVQESTPAQGGIAGSLLAAGLACGGGVC